MIKECHKGGSKSFFFTHRGFPIHFNESKDIIGLQFIPTLVPNWQDATEVLDVVIKS